MDGVHEHPEVRPRSAAAIGAACIAAVMEVIYLTIILDQEDLSDVARVGFVAAAIVAVVAAAAVGGSRSDPARRLPFLGAATGGSLMLGYLGLFSIGLPLLVAGVLAAIARGSSSRSAGPGHRRERAFAWAFALAAEALPVVGIWAT